MMFRSTPPRRAVAVKPFTPSLCRTELQARHRDLVRRAAQGVFLRSRASGPVPGRRRPERAARVPPQSGLSQLPVVHGARGV